MLKGRVEGSQTFYWSLHSCIVMEPKRSFGWLVLNMMRRVRGLCLETLPLTSWGNWGMWGGEAKGRSIAPSLSPFPPFVLGTQPFPYELAPFLKWGGPLLSSITGIWLSGFSLRWNVGAQRGRLWREQMAPKSIGPKVTSGGFPIRTCELWM